MTTRELCYDDICCGCGACVVRCPQNAISIMENEYGFTYPSRNELSRTF